MNMKKKLFSIVGVLALTMSLTGGIASAEDISIPGTATVGITVTCGTQNAVTPTASIIENGNVNFENLDPNNPAQLASRSMDTGALRVVVTVGSCQAPDWSVQASITDFTSGANSFPGTHFQLPIGEPMSSATAMTTSGDVVVSNVTSPSVPLIEFVPGSTAGTNVGNQNLIEANGQASGSMYMDFTGQLVNLDPELEDGTYTAEFTVTWNAVTP